MNPALAHAIEIALGARVSLARRAAGGDINEAWRVELGDGRRAFVKSHTRAPAGFFEAEAHGLRWLSEAAALPVPEVLAVLAPARATGSPAALVLEWIEPGPGGRADDEAFGRGLAALHRAGADGFGLDRDNFIGSLSQPNTPARDWASFYGERRLAPLAARAREAGLLSARTARETDALVTRLRDALGPDEPASRLHGDLWSGNRVRGADGRSWLVDPAVYGGHREVDLAMMRLFGGFDERSFEAYDEAFPLAPGHADRVPLYQLHPLLVHVNLFGGGYVSSYQAALASARRLLA